MAHTPYADDVRNRLTQAALDAGIDPADIEELLNREAQRIADAARPYDEAIERVANATHTRAQSYAAWQEAVIDAARQGAPLRTVAAHAGVSKSRVAQIIELVPA